MQTPVRSPESFPSRLLELFSEESKSINSFTSNFPRVTPKQANLPGELLLFLLNDHLASSHPPPWHHPPYYEAPSAPSSTFVPDVHFEHPEGRVGRLKDGLA